MVRALKPTSMGTRLEALLRPKSVAVVGASRSRASVGGEIFANLVLRPFAGTVYPVHASAHEVQGVRAYPSIAELPEAVDLAVISIPAPQVPAVLQQCATAGTKAAVVITAGFGEAGAAGADAQRHLVRAARAASIRIVGPNCLGVLNTDPEVALHATFATAWPPAGNVSIASQSGALGIALLDEARDHGIGIRHFVSLGNEADVSAEDLLEYWENDPGTRVILLYLETIRDPRRFLETARRVTRSKPIVAVKSGRGVAGARAAGSHTGALATKDVLVAALLLQAGVVRVSTLEELFDAATFLTTQQRPVGKRVAIITNAGGPGILTADACEARGLVVPQFADGTADAIKGAVPGAGAGNPLDLLAGATAQTFEAVLPLTLGDPGIDAVIVECVPTTTTDVREVARAIAAARRYAQKPIVACIMGKRGVDDARLTLAKARVPTYALPESAAAAVRAGVDHSVASAPRPTEGQAQSVTPASWRAPQMTPGEQRWLDTTEIADLLRVFGLRCLPSVTVQDAEGAIQAAEMFGWPVALKIVSRAVIHKSDIGGVLLSLPNAMAIRDGISVLRQRMERAGRGGDFDSILVQPMAPRGVEMFLGATRDPVFGPAIAFGTGGVQVSLWNDVSIRLAPLCEDEAARLVDSVRGRVLLDGFRGGPPGDRQALAAAIVQVSRLMTAVPEVLELDLNPLLALEPGRGVVAVDARVRVRSTASVASEEKTP
jgi:acetyl coenzyme A synthetase (ADP forming)-like protein